jgi:hypothetical protein
VFHCATYTDVGMALNLNRQMVSAPPLNLNRLLVSARQQTLDAQLTNKA